MISPAVQDQLAARMNARVHVLNAGHTPFLSKPKETANVVFAAVDFVRAKDHPRESIAEPHDGA
jgi:hypothetical protein